jgi:hypothetical protein
MYRSQQMPALVMPQISINGSPREMLVEQQRKVMMVLDDVATAMSHAMPHGRDYQHRPYEYADARAAWVDRMGLIADLASEISAHALRIQGDDDA